MKTVFRLEDAEGNGPFFYKNGQSRSNIELKSDDVGIFGFTDQSQFLGESYVDFYNSPVFSLYKITVSDVLSERNGEAVFLEDSIVSKEAITKGGF